MKAATARFEALPHALDADSRLGFGGQFLAVETLAFVFDGGFQGIGLLRDPHPSFAAPGVPKYIRKTLLNHAEQGRLRLNLESRNILRNLGFDLNSCPLRKSL